MKDSKGYGRESTRIQIKEKDLLVCSWCKQMKPQSDFHKDSSNKYGKAYYCKSCANEKSRIFYKTIDKIKRRQVQRNAHLKRTFGITLEEFNTIYSNQEGLCNICSIPLQKIGTYTHVDHDHKTNKVRGILCTNCNRGLGHFQDNILNLKNAVKYLKKHSINVDDTKEGRQI